MALEKSTQIMAAHDLMILTDRQEKLLMSSDASTHGRGPWQEIWGLKGARSQRTGTVVVVYLQQTTFLPPTVDWTRENEQIMPSHAHALSCREPTGQELIHASTRTSACCVDNGRRVARANRGA